MQGDKFLSVKSIRHWWRAAKNGMNCINTSLTLDTAICILYFRSFLCGRFVPLMHIISTKHRMSSTQHKALQFVALLPPNGSQSVPLVHPSLLRRQSVCGTAEGRVLQIELASFQRFLDRKLPGSRCGAKRAGSARIYSPVLQQTRMSWWWQVSLYLKEGDDTTLQQVFMFTM